MNLNLILLYAMKRFVLMNMGIIDYEFNENNESDNELSDYPELNIYEKIQILIFDFKDNNINSLKYNKDDTNIKYIPIPKPNKL